MKVITIMAGALALAGCQSMEQLRALAPQQTDYTICTSLVSMNPAMAQAAQEEQTRRRLDCSPYTSAMALEQSRINSAISTLQAAQPKPPAFAPIRPPVTCRSMYRSNGVVDTICD